MCASEVCLVHRAAIHSLGFLEKPARQPALTGLTAAADPYVSEPFLPPRLYDQRQLGMGLQLDTSSGVQQVPTSNLLWGLDRVDQQALPLNQKYQ